MKQNADLYKEHFDEYTYFYSCQEFQQNEIAYF